MSIFALSSLFVFISSSSISVFVLVKGKGRDVTRALGLFCLSVAVWGIGGYIIGTAKVEANALLGWQIGYLGAIMAPCLFYHFVYCVLNLTEQIYEEIMQKGESAS